MTAVAALRRARLAQQAYERRIPVQLELEGTKMERGGEGGAALAQRWRGTGWGHVAEAPEAETDAGLAAVRTESSSRPRSMFALVDSAPAERTVSSPMGSAESSETRAPGAENHRGAMTELENVPGRNPGVLATGGGSSPPRPIEATP